MKTLDYDLSREFLVYPGATRALEVLVKESCGALLPEQYDRLDFGHLPEAAAILARYGTTVFSVDRVVLQPGFGFAPGGKLAGRDAEQPWANDRAVILLLPLKGEKISAILAKCQELPQMAVERTMNPLHADEWSQKQRTSEELLFQRAFMGPHSHQAYA